MLKMRKGSIVPHPEKLRPAYQILGKLSPDDPKDRRRILANIDDDQMLPALRSFIEMHGEPLFFILEIPTKQQDEPRYKWDLRHTLHNDVYYIDGCDAAKALDILRQVGEIVISDGLCEFGFGCHYSGEEIMIGRYNLATLFVRDPAVYRDFFAKLGIPETDKLVTAWETFSRWHPGDSIRCPVNGKDIFDIPKLLKDKGIYFAERRESD